MFCNMERCFSLVYAMSYSMKSSFMRFSLLVIFGLVILKNSQAQQLNLSRLFYPNATLRAEYHPGATLGELGPYGMTRTSLLGFVPVQSEVQASLDRKSTRLNSSHVKISYAVFCLKKKRYKELDP